MFQCALQTSATFANSFCLSARKCTRTESKCLETHRNLTSVQHFTFTKVPICRELDIQKTGPSPRSPQIALQALLCHNVQREKGTLLPALKRESCDISSSCSVHGGSSACLHEARDSGGTTKNATNNTTGLTSRLKCPLLPHEIYTRWENFSFTVLWLMY